MLLPTTPADLVGRFGLPKRFPPEQELAYCQKFNQQWRSMRVYASLGVMLLWSAFCLWDWANAQESAAFQHVLWVSLTLRASVVVLVGAAVLLFIRYPKIEQVPELASDYVVVVAGLIATAMACWITTMPFPYNQLRGFTGTILVFFGAYALFGISTRAALKLALWHVSLIVWIVVWFSQHEVYTGDMPMLHRLHYGFAIFGLTSVFIGCATCWLIDLSYRASFLNSQALESLNTQLTQANAASEERLQALIELQARLQRETEQREKAQAQFLASAVHDLRQPVQALSTLLLPVTRAIELGQREEAHHMVQLSHQATDRLQRLLGAILEVSRLESRAIQPTLSPVNLIDVLHDLHATWAPQAQQAGVRLTLGLPEGPCWVRSDASFVQRILGNLTSNAIKYRDLSRAQQGRAWVDIVLEIEQATGAPAGGEPSHCRITLRDNGIGMKQLLIDQGVVFQPFVQLDTLHAQADKGVGLGLAIVTKLLALLPQHALSMRSQPGQGTQAEVQFPAPLPPPAVSQVLSDSTAAPHTLRGLYLWLVEDDELVRTSLACLFKSLDARVDAFADLQSLSAALETLERPPEVVISDYRLPGGATAEDVRRHIEESWGAIPMVVLSGEQRDLRQVAALAGCPCLVKPVDTQQLLSTLLALSSPGLNRVSDAD